jgi:predicted enzyme related to lactoylglutathione lyase
MNIGTMNLADATVTQLLIPIDDFERGVAFYRDVLGLPFLFAAPLQMAFFQCGSVRLLVGVTPVGQKAQRGSQIYFGVKDIQSVYSSLSTGSAVRGAAARRESISHIGNLARGVC